MKGAIFTIFQDMIETEFGLECWEQLISHPDLESKGIYTSAKNYSDEEMVILVTALSAYSGQPGPALIEHFGGYLYPHLMDSLPKSIFNFQDLWSLLAAIDDVIHLEVRKLTPDAITPVIKVLDQGENQMTLSYESPRKMCYLAIGLIRRAGEYFNTPVKVVHTQCLHDGFDRCVLTVVAEEFMNG